MAMLPLSTVAGLVAATWISTATVMSLVAWPAFVAWALFFTAGGDNQAAVKLLVSSGIGLGMGWVMLQSLSALGGGLIWLAIAVFIVAFVQLMLGNYGSVVFPPAELASTACLIAVMGASASVNAALLTVAVPWLVGIVMGLVTVWLTGLVKPAKSADQQKSKAV